MYIWLIEGPGFDYDTAKFVTTSCTTTVGFPSEDGYSVRLQVSTDEGRTAVTEAQPVKVEDFLVVALGDSYASGQGNPDTGSSDADEVVWQDDQCKRSANAWPVRVAEMLENADPHTSVTFIHLACNGAEVEKGLLKQQDTNGLLPRGNVDPQLSIAARLANGRPIDAVLLSAGGNDLGRLGGPRSGLASLVGGLQGLGRLVATCLVEYDCHESLADDLFKELKDLDKNYDKLYACLTNGVCEIEGMNGPLGVAPETIFVNEYPRLLQHPGGYCHIEPPPGTAILIPNWIETDESEWLSESLLDPNGTVTDKKKTVPGLNSAISSGDRGWVVIEGISALFADLGFCAQGQRWIVNFDDSQKTQGSLGGAFHPDETGHAVIADLVSSTVGTALGSQ